MAQGPTPRVRRRWRPWLLGGLTLLLVGCVVVVGLGVWFFNGFEMGSTIEDQLSREDIERLIEAKLPPSATAIHSYYTGFQEYFAQVRFEMSAADVSTFLASSAFTQTLSTADNPLGPGPDDRDWWRPYEAQRFQWGKSAKVGEAFVLLIDMTDPNRYIVYWQGIGT
ncbi:MAG: hypothetical protein ACJ8CR_36185 [Roseiflexaceae bacterium]